MIIQLSPIATLPGQPVTQSASVNQGVLSVTRGGITDLYDFSLLQPGGDVILEGDHQLSGTPYHDGVNIQVSLLWFYDPKKAAATQPSALPPVDVSSGLVPDPIVRRGA